jgi:predicted metal-dependent HD superfamily phosphohydrolase
MSLTVLRIQALVEALRLSSEPASARTTGSGLSPEELLRRVVAAWSEPHRHYHTLEHLSECLQLVDEPAVHALLERPAEVEAALLFHDLIYDTTRSDNEERSADEAVQLLEAVGGIAPEVCARIAALIRSTKSHVASSPDGAVLLDLDLAILGASPARFAAYEAQIRQEYVWVPDDAYAAGRGRVLAGFAARPRLYTTPLLHDRLERQARANLSRALARPGSGAHA